MSGFIVKKPSPSEYFWMDRTVKKSIKVYIIGMKKSSSLLEYVPTTGSQAFFNTHKENKLMSQSSSAF
jgi:hypothetical protein